MIVITRYLYTVFFRFFLAALLLGGLLVPCGTASAQPSPDPVTDRTPLLPPAPPISGDPVGETPAATAQPVAPKSGKVITVNGAAIRVSGAGKVPAKAPEPTTPAPSKPAKQGAAGVASGATAKSPAKSLTIKPQNPPRVGPFSLVSDDGKHRITLKMAAQLRLSASNVPDGDKRASEVSIQLRRIRPSLGGTILSKDLSFKLQLSTSPGSLEVLDFLLDYRFFSWLQLRVGQFKIPFGNHRFGSFSTLTMADWSLVTRYFGSERQMGLTVHNGWKKPPTLEYQLGLFAGPNARASHATGLSRVYGEKAPNSSDLKNFNPVSSIHPELVAHLAYNSPGMRPRFDTDWRGGTLRIHTGVAFSWDFRPELIEDLNLRFGAQFLAKAFGASLAAQAYIAAVRTPEDEFGQREFAFYGGLVQASYLLRRRLEFALRYAGVQVDDTLAWRASRRAWWQLWTAETPELRAALAKKYTKTGQLVRDQEVGFGVNLYLIGNSLKWQNDFVFLIKSYQEDTETTFTFRSQAQLAF